MSAALCGQGLRRVGMFAGALLVVSMNAWAAESDDVVAVYASVSPAYVRTKLVDGTYKPESFAFGEGGRFGGTKSDATIDGVRFLDVAQAIAPALAGQGYVPCDPKKPRETNLLIMVYWGTTIGTDNAAGSSEYQIARSLQPAQRAPIPPPPNGLSGTAMVSDPTASGATQQAQEAAIINGAADSVLQQSLTMTGLANRQRDQQEYENAMILGFLPELKRVEGYKLTALNRRRQDVVDEVAESRYYVVLLAYDFQTLRKSKERKLMWETRFSIRERHNEFGKQLAGMALTASRYFGQESAGIRRKPLLEGHVDLGETKTLEEVGSPAAAKSGKP
ncbi:MAG: hypothetical protein ABIZ04_27375 [Opitutus sp.]